jgi:HPt (histidine-containing phosphotransfer) domain-containing protein
MEPAANQAGPPALAATLNRLWTRFLPEFRERVSVVEAAVQSLAAGALTAEQQEAAHAAAHKLSGTLGTFNLPRGTDLARELELAFAAAPDPASAPHLSSLAAELRTLIETRK